MRKGQFVFDSRNPSVRILLFGVIVAVLVSTYFAVRWQLGDMLAELTSPADPEVSNIADVAETLAPRDPRAKWLEASAATAVFSPEAIDTSVSLFGDTVRLSAYDFRWWVEYGRSLERAGRGTEAEAALNQAIRIAPNYAHPRWQLGNFFLRQGRNDDAFRELRLATRNNPTYRNQVFSLVWDYFGHDTSQVEQIAADAPEVKGELALFLAWRVQPAESLKIWNSLSGQQKSDNNETAKRIAQALYQTGAFREGVELSRQSDIDPDAAPESITNPGFESPLRGIDDTYFGWKIDRSDGRAEFSADSSVRHSGARSLRVTFRNFSKLNFNNLWQNVAVTPGTKYRLSFWVRTESLRSGGPPLVEVVNSADSKILASSRTFPLGTNEWQQMSMEFTTPDESKGIFLRTTRGYCGETCPIVGIVWVDDFAIAKG